MAYSYLKAPAKGKIFFKPIIFFLKWKSILNPLFIIVGLIMLGLVTYPFLAYKLLVFQKLSEKIIAPVSETLIAEAQGIINFKVAGLATQKNVSQVSEEKEIDYNLINNWFPTTSLPSSSSNKATHYTLSIPKLKISQAIVEIGGIEVKKSLVQYPGTALPGEYGNVVIFGHSILPIFYRPTDYKAIFSLIPTLKKGDPINLSYDGIEYVYEVYDYEEVKPDEFNVLEQRLDQRTLSLITCVPPGTYKARGIIKARLISL